MNNYDNIFNFIEYKFTDYILELNDKFNKMLVSVVHVY